MDIALMGLAVGAIASTIAVSKMPIFYPLRRWYLFRCPYCLGHWIAFVVCWKHIYKFDIVTPFAVVAIAAFTSALISKSLKEMNVDYDYGDE